jgi:hypothetical protein
MILIVINEIKRRPIVPLCTTWNKISPCLFTATQKRFSDLSFYNFNNN